MSIFNVDSANDFNVRFNSVLGEEVWTKNEATGEYVRLQPGDGGGGSIPYYCKTNSIEMTGANSSGTTISPGSISTELLGSSAMLSGANLVLSDSTDYSVLTRADVETVNKLHAAETSPLITAVEDTLYTAPIIYNEAEKSYKRTSVLSLISEDEDSQGTMTPTGFKVEGVTTPAQNCAINLNGITNQGTTHRLQAGGHGGGIVFRNTGVNKGVVIRELSVMIGTTPGYDGISQINPYSRLEEGALIFRDSSGTVHTLDKNDIIASNKIKNIATATPVAASRMVTYNISSHSFGYTAIPNSVEPAVEPKVIKVSGKNWNEDATTGLHWTSKAMLSALPYTDLGGGNRQVNYFGSRFYDRKLGVTMGTPSGPIVPYFYSIPGGTLNKGDVIELSILGDGNDILGPNEYNIFIAAPEFNVANYQFVDCSATSNSPYLFTEAHGCILDWYENGYNTDSGLGTVYGILLTYIYNDRAKPPAETDIYQHLLKFRIKYNGVIADSVNRTPL